MKNFYNSQLFGNASLVLKTIYYIYQTFSSNITKFFKGLLTKNGKCALLYMIANSFTTKYDDPMTETKNCSLYKNYCDQKTQ